MGSSLIVELLGIDNDWQEFVGRVLGKAVRIRYCPATVSDLKICDGHCLMVGRPSQEM